MIVYVKIKPDQHYGDDLHEVIATRGIGYSKEYTLKNTKTGEKFNLFAAHCYENLETKRASNNARKEFAQSLLERSKTIGQNKRKTKRK